MFNLLSRYSAGARYLTVVSSSVLLFKNCACDSAEDTNVLTQQPHFLRTFVRNTGNKKSTLVTLDNLALISGTAHKAIADEISDIIGLPLVDSEILRFADGEVSIKINENIRGKNVFIIQSCAAPVNDSILELLLTVSTARRAGAQRVVAVIPYFGYKHHRRGSALSTTSHSRFLNSVATDFARMLQEMGVDHVIAVDLQRSGQGHEACFFDNSVPLETLVTTDHLVAEAAKTLSLQQPIVVATPNSECVKKALHFQQGFKRIFGGDVKFAAFFRPDTYDLSSSFATNLDLLGNAQVAGADVVVVDDIVDTGGTISLLAQRLKNEGARNVYVCASHGVFTEKSIQVIEDSSVDKVIITNSLPLPSKLSTKVTQVSVAPLLADLILAEHFRSVSSKDEVFEMDD